MKLVNCIITVPKGGSIRLDSQDEYVNTRQVETTVAYLASKDKEEKKAFRFVRLFAGLFKFISVILFGLSYRYKLCCIWAFATNKPTMNIGGHYGNCVRCVTKKHKITMVKGVKGK